jgi:ATP-binding cassette subfamily F protein 3
VSDGLVNDYEGDLDDYDAWVAQRRSESPPAAGVSTNTEPSPGPDAPRAHRAESAPSDRRTERRHAAERRAALAALTRDLDKEIKQIETSLQSIEAELRSVDTAIQDPSLYAPGADGARIAELNRRRAALARDRDQAENHWLELQTQRDEQIAAFSSPD